jgi:hypothetical protein
MIKDLSEAIYYCTITKSMEEAEEEKKRRRKNDALSATASNVLSRKDERTSLSR